MLTIKKHPLSLKAATLGTIAFLIGLSGAAMYIDRFRQHENLVFGRAETILGTSDARPAEQKSPADEAQRVDSSRDTASPQVVTGSASLAPAPASSAITSTPLATSSTSTMTPSVVGGMGAGETTTVPVTDTTTPADPVTTPPSSGGGSVVPTNPLEVVPNITGPSLDPVVSPLLP